MKLRTLLIATLFLSLYFSSNIQAQYGPLYWHERGYDSITNYREAMKAFNQKDLGKAILILDSASNIYASKKEYRKQYLVENEKGAMIYLSKDYRKSLDLFEQNMNRMRENNDTLNYEFAISLRFMGYLASDYRRTDKSKLFYLKNQIDVLGLMHDESAIYIDCLGDMGLSLRGADQDLGLEYLLKSKKMAQKLDLTNSIVIIDNTITNRFALEQPYLSLKVQECLLATASRQNYRDSVVLVMLAYHVATKNKEIKNYENAIKFFEYADTLMKATNNPHRKMSTTLPIEKLQCYSLMGDKEKFINQVHQSIDTYYNTAETVKIDECELYSVIGNNYMPFSIDSSLFYLNKAYQILTQNETLIYDSLDQAQAESLAKIFNAQTNAYLQIGKIEKAKHLILESIKIYTGTDEHNQPNFTCDEENDFILIETYLIASDVFSKSLKTNYRSDIYDLTLKIFFCCDTIMRRLAVNISDQNSILDFAKEYKQLTANLLSIKNLSTTNPEVAFHFASNSKAFLLMADIKKHNFIDVDKNHNWLAKNKLEKQLRICTNEKNDAKRKNNTSLVDSLTFVEKDILIDLIVVNYRIMKSQNDDFQYFDNKDISQMITGNIANNHLLIDIFQTDSIAYVFTINKSGLSYFSINNIDKLDYLANQFYKELKTGKNFKKSSQLLSNILLKPIAEKLKICTEITFIPDKVLCQIPFEVLINPNTGNMLLSSHAISYHYSTLLWNKSIKKEKPKRQAILAIAPVFENNSNNTLNTTFRDQHAEDGYLYNITTNDILPLPYTGIETKEIINLFQSKGILNHLLINKDATKDHFLSQSTKYSILHVASHGYVSKISPNHSGFFLYSGENNDSTENSIGFVNMSEIYSLKTNADLVVLSACNSGVGPIYEGEGLMALPRGFIYAGVPNVMASLWKVHDEKTKDLMLFFYQHLLSGDLYAEALRKAKQDCINKGYLPIDWAGFVIIGK